MSLSKVELTADKTVLPVGIEVPWGEWLQSSAHSAVYTNGIDDGLCRQPRTRLDNTHLVMINGPCGAGKSTISRVLAERLPNAVLLSTDDLRDTMPEPLIPDVLGRDERFAFMKDVNFVGRQIAKKALLADRDVIVDGILYEDEWIDPWTDLGEACGAQVADVCVYAPKATVTERVLRRDANENSRLTPAKISDLYDKVMSFYVHRPDSFVVRSDELTPMAAANSIVYYLDYGIVGIR